MNQLSEKITIDATDPESIAAGLQAFGDHINALHANVDVLCIAIGILANASEAGHLAKPGAVRSILKTLINTFGERAPLATKELEWALDAQIGSPPPDGGTHLTIVRSDEGERKAA